MDSRLLVDFSDSTDNLDIFLASSLAGQPGTGSGERYGSYDATIDGASVTDTVSRFLEQTTDHGTGGIFGLGTGFTADTHTGYFRHATDKDRKSVV